jgi:hypothetical protein
VLMSRERPACYDGAVLINIDISYG